MNSFGDMGSQSCCNMSEFPLTARERIRACVLAAPAMIEAGAENELVEAIFNETVDEFFREKAALEAAAPRKAFSSPGIQYSLLVPLTVEVFLAGGWISHPQVDWFVPVMVVWGAVLTIAWANWITRWEVLWGKLIRS